MGLHAFLTAVLNLLSFFCQNTSKIVVKKPSRCLVGHLKHIKGKAGIPGIAYLTFVLVLIKPSVYCHTELHMALLFLWIQATKDW